MSAGGASSGLFAPETVFAHVRTRLDFGVEPAAGGRLISDPGLEEELLGRAGAGGRRAAVLIGLVAYPDEVRVLLTQRAAHLRDHAGQIAFPGGKIEPKDASPAAAAMRESEEEIGLSPRLVEPLGYLDSYLTGTGFHIVPVVARVEPDFELRPNPAEVDDVFEAPFAFLMDAANHSLDTWEIGGKLRKFYVMPYGERRIWGITAGILRNLYQRLYS